MKIPVNDLTMIVFVIGVVFLFLLALFLVSATAGYGFSIGRSMFNFGVCA